MHDDGYCNERVAASYNRPDSEEFDPAVIETIVDFLVEWRAISTSRWLTP